jgi:hypothetical protein
MCGATVCAVGSNPAKLDSSVSKAGGSRISRITDESSETMTADPEDWRTPLVHIANRKVRWQAMKYVMLDNALYRQTIDGLLFKCLGLDHARIAMGEVHEGICGTHQSAH